MRLPVCQFLLDYEGLPLEDFEVEGGLACESLWRMQGIMNALYEYLTDKAAGGAESITVEGHRHGRMESDGRYIRRNGSANAAWLPRQSSSTALNTAGFEVLDRSMPSGGSENQCQGLVVNAICFYCRKDYLALDYTCRARCSSSDTSGFVRMKIYDGDGLLVSQDECAVNDTSWIAYSFMCELSGDDDCEGWLCMKLEYGVSGGSGSIELCAADRWNGGGHGAAAEIILH